VELVSLQHSNVFFSVRNAINYYYFLLLLGRYWVPRYLFKSLGIYLTSPWYCGHFGLLYNPDDRRGWFLEQLVEWNLAGETEVLLENLPQRHFVHHKIPHDRLGLESRTAAVGNQQLTAKAMTRPFLVPFLRLLRLTGSRWTYSTPPPHGCKVVNKCNLQSKTPSRVTLTHDNIYLCSACGISQSVPTPTWTLTDSSIIAVKESRFVLGRFLVQISNTDYPDVFSGLYSVPPGKCRDHTSVKPQPLNSKSLEFKFIILTIRHYVDQVLTHLLPA
jgi:hypothetical protein